MSSTSRKFPIVTTPRLITVGRGKGPTIPQSTEARPGPAAVGRERELRRPNIAGQAAVTCNGSNDGSSLLTENVKTARHEHDAAKDEQEMEIKMLKKKFAKMELKVKNLEEENVKDLEIKRLQQELAITQKLLEIQIRTKEVSPPSEDPEQSVDASCPPKAEQVVATSHVSREGVPQAPTVPLPSLRWRELPPLVEGVHYPSASSAVHPPTDLLSTQTPPLLPTLTPRDPLGRSQLPPPPPAPSSDFHGMNHFNFQQDSNTTTFSDRREPEVRVNDHILIEEQERILKQIQEDKLKKSLEESRSLELIQQMRLEDNCVARGSLSQSGPSQRGSYSLSNSSSADESGAWTKVTKPFRAQAGYQKQDMARREQKEIEEKEWAEWRQQMMEKEQREKTKILKTHEESQKLRIIKGDLTTEAIGPSQYRVSETVANESRAKPSLRDRTTPSKSPELSEFDIARRKATAELRQRIEDQVKYKIIKIHLHISLHIQEKERRAKMRQERLQKEWELARTRRERAANTQELELRGKRK